MAAVMEVLGSPDDFNSSLEATEMHLAVDMAEAVASLIEEDKATRLVHHVGRYSLRREIYDFAKEPGTPITFGNPDPLAQLNFPHLN